MQTKTSLHKDYVASFLKAQLVTLGQVLDNIEHFNASEQDYTVESLKRVETEVRRLRKFLEN